MDFPRADACVFALLGTVGIGIDIAGRLLLLLIHDVALVEASSLVPLLESCLPFTWPNVDCQLLDDNHPDPLSGFLPLIEIGCPLVFSACDGELVVGLVLGRLVWPFTRCFGP